MSVNIKAISYYLPKYTTSSSNLKNDFEDFDIDKIETKVGFIRFDKKLDFNIIGINIAPKERGKGYSSKLLKLSSNFIENSILAYIKPENIGSLKAFEKAGYKYLKEDLVNNQNCKVYSYEQ